MHGPAPPDEARAGQMLLAGNFSGLASCADILLRDASAAPSTVVEYVALACTETGRFADAEKLLRSLLERDPQNLSYQTNLGVVLLRSGHYATARDMLLDCRERAADRGVVDFNLGLAHFALGDFHPAADLLREHLGEYPDDAVARIYLARACIELSDIDGADALIQDRSFADVRSVRERYELSQIHLALGDSLACEQMLQDILRDDPDDTASRMSLAAVMERSNRRDAARHHLDLIPDAQKSASQWLLLHSKLEFATGQSEHALQALEQAQASAENSPDLFAQQRLLSDIAFERARQLDKLKSYDQAYAACTEANLRLRNYFRGTGSARSEEPIFGLQDLASLDAVVKRAAAFDTPHESPVFIVGFPRSGTTLLDQLLDAHPAFQVMEEKPALEAVVAELGRRGPPDLTALEACNARDLERLRALYWSTVARHLRRHAGTRLVDKYPFNLARLHVGMCLFPHAQWIFAMRHPCDVVLSCFMQNLRYTQATQGFWSLEQSAGVYAQMVGLWLRQRGRLQPDSIDLRYEDLVQDFRANAARLLDFLGVAWDDRVLAYHEHAKTRRINTPSYSQVVQPIYRSAVMRWQHYRRWFGGAESILAPFVTRLGYPALAPSGNAASSSGS